MAEKSLKFPATRNNADLPRFYEFGEFRVDSEKRLLSNAGANVPLVPKAFDVLLTLLRRHGEVVTKDDLMTSVWRDTVVEENSLNVNISTLRKLLGEKPYEHRFIVTVPGVGYQFVADVKEIFAEPKKIAPLVAVANQETKPGMDAVAPNSRFPRALGWKILLSLLAVAVIAVLVYMFRPSRVVAPGARKLRTVAVLPFRSLSSEGGDESLEMGMAETLATKLSLVNTLVVRPMSAVRKYTDPNQDPVEIGRKLRVDAILDGSVQKAGDRLRVTVRLTSIDQAATLWAAQFDENSGDILKVQDSIAERTANALLLKLSGEEQKRIAKRYTNSAEAYQLYLQGQNLWTKRIPDDYWTKIKYYQQAIDKDPAFALAYVGMAVTYIKLNGHLALGPDEASAKARAALKRALELDDSLAEAHNTLAEIQYQYDYDWQIADKEFKRALELNSNVAQIHQSYGWYLMSAGRFDEALVEYNKAEDLDPQDSVISIVKARLFYFMRDYDRSIAELQKVLAVEPSPAAHWALGMAYERKGAYREAVEEYIADITLQGKVTPEQAEELRTRFRTSGWPGVVQKQLDAQLELAKKQYVSPVKVAETYIRLGRKKEALFWLEKTVDTRDVGSVGLKIEPLWDGLRSDPAFLNLLKRTNQTP